jgi:regulatory protein
MVKDLTHQKALDTAYRLLSNRPHTRAELKLKLSRKGASAEIILQILDELTLKGYIDEDDMALRWAQALVRDKLWGPLKVAAYLMQKGISHQQIDQVQRQVWQEFDEPAIARLALSKRFSATDDDAPAAKKGAFLRSRGFSSGVIWSLVKEANHNDRYE